MLNLSCWSQPTYTIWSKADIILASFTVVVLAVTSSSSPSSSSSSFLFSLELRALVQYFGRATAEHIAPVPLPSSSITCT